VSDTADSTPAIIETTPVEPVQVEAKKPAKSTPARRRTPAAAKGNRRTTRPARKAPATARTSSASSKDAAGSLASALRGLVGGIETEVAAITGLSAEIDRHVTALNDLRAEATRRLLHLDDLRAAAEDVNLSAFLDTSIQPQLPQVEEEFPDRIYGG
jgi:hypothetical protein